MGTNEKSRLSVPLEGMSVHCNELLPRNTPAVVAGRCLHVTPSLMSLITSSNPEELDHLFRHLKVLDLSRFGVSADLFATADIPPSRWDD